MKSFIALFVLFLSLNTYASLTLKEFNETLSGRYKIEIDGIVCQLVIHTNKKIEILNAGDEINFASLKISNGKTEGLMDGAPVANLLLTSASDEDTTDYHINLFVTQEENQKQLTVINSFSTTNDGPNSWTSFNKKLSLKIQKYNKQSGKFVEIK